MPQSPPRHTPDPADAAAALDLGSGLRSRSAHATWAAAAPLMPALGISRVTDITRMDRLGLPVHASVRPRGKALCVHAGKGLDATESRVGALMEALEYTVAEPEQSRWVGRSLCIGELLDDWAGAFALMDLAPRFGIVAAQERLLHCVHCKDMVSGAAHWLPAELVFMPFADPHGPVLFGWSSNGLASGNTLAEASLHGLLEVLERDALAMNLPRDDSAWLEADTLPARFADMAQAWARLGVSLAIRYVPNAFGLPCFQAFLVEDSRDHPIDLSEGSGLHLDAGIALSRAVCEAAQSRLSTIHGGRDDVTDFYETRAAQGSQCDVRRTAAYQQAFDRSRSTRWDEVPSVPVQGRSIEALLDQLLKHLAVQGFSRVLRHRFECELNGLCVVRVVVPRCQFVEVPLLRAGRRLLDLAGKHV